MKITAIIPAAGSGSRYSKVKNKLLESLNGMPVIINTLKTIADVNTINEIIISTSPDLIDEIKNIVEKYSIEKVKGVVLGGKTRQESVFLALKYINNNPDFVLIHDAARPLISKEIISDSISTAIAKGACVVAVPVKDTIKSVNMSTNFIKSTLNRQELWSIQTPQVFNYSQLLNGHIKYCNESFTDDSGIIEKLNIPVQIVMGSYKNIKITTEEDLEIAKIFIKQQ